MFTMGPWLHSEQGGGVLGPPPKGVGIVGLELLRRNALRTSKLYPDACSVVDFHILPRIFCAIHFSISKDGFALYKNISKTPSFLQPC